MPTAPATVSRRRVLVGAAAMALLGGTVTTACGSTPPVEQVDALVAQLQRANDDAGLASKAAATAAPTLSAALTAIAQQRAAHASALTDEITRISGQTPVTSTSSSPTSATPTTSAPPPKPTTAADVAAALRQSADGASLLATQQSGYRAGLLGSIAAACTAAYTVALANLGPTA